MTEDKVFNFSGTIHTEDLEARKFMMKLEAKIDRLKDKVHLIEEEIKKIKNKDIVDYSL